MCNAGAVVTTLCRNGCTPGTGCNSLPPVGFLCDGGQCAPGGVCQQDTSGQGRCCVRNCAAEGKVCSPSGSCDCPPGQVAAGNTCLLEPGDPCQNGTQCQTGLSCVDGVCCREACGGYCERCQSGTGQCLAIPAGQQEVDPASGNNCSNGFECTGQRNGCRARTGQACTSTDGSGCVSGNCEPTAGGALVCCSQACSGVRDTCRSSGQGCVECESAAECGNGCNVGQGTCNALRAPGETCSVSGQCSTNRCVPASDGNFSRCCPNCAQGQVCNPQGQCVSNLTAPGDACTANGQCQSGVCTGGFCCGAGPCSGPCSVCQQNTGACIASAPRTPCGPAGSHLVCIGSTCTLPTVRCAGVNRQVTSTMACCESRDIFGTATETFTSLGACPPVGIDVGQATTPITCDEPTDCPLGETCCLHNDGDSSLVSCVAEGNCADFATQEVCSSPAGGTGNCRVGTCQNYFLEGFVPGWQFCDP